ncbi:hypothetical protein [Thaumasiovibrio sp. DFM-14]|uniref:hypothetical protein n=1 Tax=Thaumasiovibrio sp. DFM-14 TaxID=3384792 RepID=UPI00399F877B
MSEHINDIALAFTVEQVRAASENATLVMADHPVKFQDQSGRRWVAFEDHSSFAPYCIAPDNGNDISLSVVSFACRKQAEGFMHLLRKSQ